MVNSRVAASGGCGLALATHKPPSVAVSPFVNRSRDEDDEHFSDGLVDERLNVLARNCGLRVVARSSAFMYQGKGASVAGVR